MITLGSELCICLVIPDQSSSFSEKSFGDAVRSFTGCFCYRPQFAGSDETLDSEDSQLSILLTGSEGLAQELEREIQVLKTCLVTGAVRHRVLICLFVVFWGSTSSVYADCCPTVITLFARGRSTVGQMTWCKWRRTKCERVLP